MCKGLIFICGAESGVKHNQTEGVEMKYPEDNLANLAYSA